MKRNIVMKNGFIVLLALALSGALAFCGKKEQAQTDVSGRKMLVVLASGDAEVTRQGNKLPVKVGLVVQTGDLINTGSGSMDLQTRNGSAIRLKENSSVAVDALTEGAQQETTLALNKGGLLATVDKQNRGSSYKIVTPTAIAGVRGTSYSITVDDSGKNPRVRVLDGAVALSPRIAALEKYSAEEIKQDPALAKLAAVQQKEVVLNQSTEGKLDNSLEQKLDAVNSALASNQGELKNLSEEVTKNSDSGLQAEKTVISQEERADRATLIVVDPSTFDSALESSLNGDTNAAATLLANARDEKTASILQELQSAAAERNLSSQKEISAYYQKTYTIKTTDGKTYSGALMARDSGMVILHTEKGIVKLEQGKIQSIR